MQHVTSLEELHLTQPACLTIGVFDGVHRGHQALIGEMVKHAHTTGRSSVVVTFYPHPSVILRGRRPSFYISMPGEKAAYLAELGVDVVVTHPFNTDVSQVSAEDFVARLVTHAHLNELWCSEGFALGHNREGDIAFLRAAGARQGFTVHLFPPVLMDGEEISSTRIRQALRDGAVEQAARYLGRPFRLAGRVIEGAKRGRTLGIPTANLEIDEERAFPAIGVYACRAQHAAGTSLAVVNIGFRPTFDSPEGKPKVEAHLLDFSGDLYGSSLTLDFIARLRPEMKFPNIEALLAQIHQDIASARQILEENVIVTREA